MSSQTFRKARNSSFLIGVFTDFPYGYCWLCAIIITHAKDERAIRWAVIRSVDHIGGFANIGAVNYTRVSEQGELPRTWEVVEVSRLNFRRSGQLPHCALGRVGPPNPSRADRILPRGCIYGVIWRPEVSRGGF